MNRRMAIALMALFGLFIGAYLTLYKFGVIGELTCSVGSCERVQSSRWSIFAGLPVAAWGVGYYALVVLLAFLGLQERFAGSGLFSGSMLVLTAWGAIFSLWLTYLEFFVIHAICQWCVISATLALALFVVALLDWRSARRQPAA
jgi:uncharacterized membrane protein